MRARTQRALDPLRELSRTILAKLRKGASLRRQPSPSVDPQPPLSVDRQPLPSVDPRPPLSVELQPPPSLVLQPPTSVDRQPLPSFAPEPPPNIYPQPRIAHPLQSLEKNMRLQPPPKSGLVQVPFMPASSHAMKRQPLIPAVQLRKRKRTNSRRSWQRSKTRNTRHCSGNRNGKISTPSSKT